MFDAAHLPLPAYMGIVNVTPDSFSDGTVNPQAAADRARTLVRQGAHILDLGAEASSFFRPGITPTTPQEQLRRLLPVLELLTDLPPRILLSIDTRSARVAGEILARTRQTPALGNRILINDISAGEHDPALLPAVAAHQAAVILMHIAPGYPATPPADDPDILQTVSAYLLERARAAQHAGIPSHMIALDPGLGFGKTMADNWRLALRAGELADRLAPYPLVLGASRKRFLETPLPADTPPPGRWTHILQRLGKAIDPSGPAAAHPRDAASAALALMNPRAIHRLHNLAFIDAVAQ